MWFFYQRNILPRCSFKSQDLSVFPVPLPPLPFILSLGATAVANGGRNAFLGCARWWGPPEDFDLAQDVYLVSHKWRRHCAADCGICARM